MHSHHTRWVWLPWLILASCQTSSAPPTKAANPGETSGLTAVVEQARYRHAHWGWLMVDLASGATVTEQHADHQFAPASTAKLFTVAAALATLGHDYRFVTHLRRQGEADSQGTLHGNLVLVASGDPTLGGRTLANGQVAYSNSDHTYANGNTTATWTTPEPLAGLHDLARQVAAAGIRSIDGEVIVDDRLFDQANSTGSGPSVLAPILVNDNLVDVEITPGAAGSLASIRWRPTTTTFAVDAQVKTVATGTGKPDIHMRQVAPRKLEVRGTIPEGHSPLLRVHEVSSPAAHARLLLIEALRGAGVTVNAASTDNRQELLPEHSHVVGLPSVAALTSPTLAEHARLILKVSHNLHSSLLPLILAVHDGKRGLSDGLKRMGTALRQLDVDIDAMALGGGAGGARVDATTPRVTVGLLRRLHEQPIAPDFQSLLPILGVDGTLTTVVAKDSPARGKVQAKTGTYFLANPLNQGMVLTSKALAGYLEGQSGRRYAFALFVNGVPMASEDEIAEIGRDLGRICEHWVTSY